MKDLKEPEEIVEEALGITVEWNGSQYVAEFSIPNTHNIMGYGSTEDAAVRQLLLRGYAAPYDMRRRLQKVIDIVMGRVSEEIAPIHWSFSFKEDKCYVTATDDQGRSNTTFVHIERKRKNGFEEKTIDGSEEETG